MKGIFSVLVISLLILGCNQNQSTDFGDEVFPPGSVIDAYDEYPGLVRVTIYDSQGEVAGEGDFFNGRKHGVWAEYDAENRRPLLIQNFYQGKKQGIELTFDSNGGMITKAGYRNDVLHGSHWTYQGRKVIEEKQYAYGQLHGMVRKFYRTGKVQEEAPYENGQINGIAKWYDQEGALIIQYRYENGELVEELPVDGGSEG